MQIPDLMEALSKKGLVLQIHYSRPVWVLEARSMSKLELVGTVSESEFGTAVRSLLQELHLLD